MKVIPLTVLAYEGPLLRSYLATMRRAGLRPERLVLMVLSRHPRTRKAVGLLLPRRLRMRYAEKSQDLALNHWSRHIRKSHAHIVDAMADALKEVCPEAGPLIKEISGPFQFEQYADSVEKVFVEGLGDRRLATALVAGEHRATLYTGGGLLPPSLLDLPNVRFLHVHPGYLPRVRGADGLLWSILLRGRPAMSCFYMARGIDTGEIVKAFEYPALRFDISGGSRPDDQMLYRAIFSFCDSLLRADFLVRHVLPIGDDLSALPGSPQHPADGVTYHFMHPDLRQIALQSIFNSAPSRCAQRTNEPVLQTAGCRPS